MSRNRRRHSNQVPVRALSPWVVLCAIALIGGLSWVNIKNQIFTKGQEIKRLESQLAEIETQSKALDSRIAILSSRTALQKRVSDGFIKVIPIAQERVVQVNVGPNGVYASLAGGDEIRAVSNVGAGR